MFRLKFRSKQTTPTTTQTPDTPIEVPCKQSMNESDRDILGNCLKEIQHQQNTIPIRQSSQHIDNTDQSGFTHSDWHPPRLDPRLRGISTEGDAIPPHPSSTAQGGTPSQRLSNDKSPQKQHILRFKPRHRVDHTSHSTVAPSTHPPVQHRSFVHNEHEATSPPDCQPGEPCRVSGDCSPSISPLKKRPRLLSFRGRTLTAFSPSASPAPSLPCPNHGQIDDGSTSHLLSHNTTSIPRPSCVISPSSLTQDQPPQQDLVITSHSPSHVLTTMGPTTHAPSTVSTVMDDVNTTISIGTQHHHYLNPQDNPLNSGEYNFYILFDESLWGDLIPPQPQPQPPPTPTHTQTRQSLLREKKLKLQSKYTFNDDDDDDDKHDGYRGAYGISYS